jgi:hypothetical protein
MDGVKGGYLINKFWTAYHKKIIQNRLINQLKERRNVQMAAKQNYFFEWKNLKTGITNKQYIPADSEEKAREGIVARIADFEFMDEKDVELGKFLEKKELNDFNYIECANCSS